MENATNSPGPVSGHPYAVIVITGGFDIERFSFKEPLDALVAGVRYLRDGRQARLTDRTVAALKEVPQLAALEDLLALSGHPEALAAMHATRQVPSNGADPVFKAADARGPRNA